jgi:hypothetical protein
MAREDRTDPRARPDDPAGTKPKVDVDSLVPVVREPLLPPAVDTTAVEEAPDLLPDLVRGAPPVALVEPAQAPRFQFLLGALFALGLAAIVGVVAVAMQGRSHHGFDSSWSSWHPNGSDPLGQIATHVSREYRLGSGSQLVLVQGGPLQVENVPLTIVLRQAPAAGGNIQVVDGKSVLYRMCGLGQSCRITEGTPSHQRFFLLEREALELALYTFHYTDADNVVAFLPPAILQPVRKTAAGAKAAKPKTRTQAMFFRRGDVNAEIERPLSATLTKTTPLPSTVIKSPDAGFVNQLTTAKVFQFSFSPSNQDNHGFLVLQPEG